MKKLIPSYVRVPLIFAFVFGALEYFIDSGDRPAFIKFPMVGLFLVVFLFLLVAIEIVISAIDKVTYHMLTDAQRQQLKEAQSVSFTESKWIQGLMKSMTRSKAIEQEADVMLEHDYDGIKELDNVLPPWWVYLFYITIIFSIVYLVRFHVMGDYNQAQEFDQEVAAAKLEIEKNQLIAPKEEITLDKVTMLTDAESLAKGKEIFANACAACHKADGGGVVGPNLTDEYWINGGGIKNVFKLIAEGSKNNPTMVGWAKTLGTKEVQKVASYVMSLQGTKPAGAKAPEGEKWVEEAAPKTEAAPVADSTSVVQKQ
ncbi:cbb3-type cytochrome c oxidase N-terminal domain-containing protein [Flavobacterium sedimenticola]|uniref:Cbb3-type cytochrome c oxidase N-terminal domain-containing protein n=1 Tax=Flavobacterium sedimenticola TaxID=3043286 RepID=A0ABT6XNR0_9FLAO|nr:cbb3-type cytochrome c oxidase N-terminal domain-containing protein [Flavobacterium sedimenticola]MDI9256724.1 cbb3-type cytochrome c oxidase N-terminal domain-containing protein [Flavobacterium sedimenticola]